MWGCLERQRVAQMDNRLDADGTAGSFAGHLLGTPAATARNCPGESQHSSHASWSPSTAPSALGELWHSSPLPQGTPTQLPLPLGEHWQSSLCPGRVLAQHPLPSGDLAQLPLLWGDLAQLPLPLVKHWHSSLCPWRSPGTAPSALGEHWHSFSCPKRALTQLPFPSGGHPGTACRAPGGVLAQLPLPHGALAQLPPPQGSPGTAPSAPWSPGKALSTAGKHWHRSLSPWESPGTASYTPGRVPLQRCRAFQHLAKPLRLLALG